MEILVVWNLISINMQVKTIVLLLLPVLIARNKGCVSNCHKFHIECWVISGAALMPPTIGTFGILDLQRNIMDLGFSDKSFNSFKAQMMHPKKIIQDMTIIIIIIIIIIRTFALLSQRLGTHFLLATTPNYHSSESFQAVLYPISHISTSSIPHPNISHNMVSGHFTCGSCGW